MRFALVAACLSLSACSTGPLHTIGLKLAKQSLTVPSFQITADQGDGSQCTGTKYADTNVNFILSCVNPNRGLLSGTQRIFRAGGLQPRITSTQTASFGDLACLFGVNPTAFPNSFGSLGSVPATSIAYACSANVRSAGVITGQIPGPTGVVAWP